MLHVLRQRNFALLWIGGFISTIGDWMLLVALPIYVFQVTGSALATGLMTIAGVVPSILLGSIAGVFVDRWDRKRTMVITNLLLGLTLIPVLFIYSIEWLWVIYIIAFIQSSIAQFFVPATTAFIPSLVDEKQLLTANSLNALSRNLSRLIGPTIGGLMTAAIGLQSVVLLDAVTFFIAALMIALIQSKARAAQPAATESSASLLGLWRTIIREWLDGLRLVGQESLVRNLFIIAAIMSFGAGFFPVLFPPFVIRVLHGDSLMYGWLMSAQAIGGLVGGIMMGQLGNRLSSSRVFSWNVIYFGVIDLILFNAPTFFSENLLVLSLILMIGAGITSLISLTILSTFLQTNVADLYRGRIFGTYGTMSSLISIFGTGIASAFGDRFGIVPILNIQGVAYIIGGMVALFLLSSVHAAKVSATPNVS
jgi:MFS family permease